MALPGLKTLEVPFSQGLSQKEEPLWLEPGSSAVATNLVKLKNGSLTKRPGNSLLSTSGHYPQIGQTTGPAFSVTAGKRLFSFKGQLGLIGQETFSSITYPDAVLMYDEQAGAPVLMDRAPEVYFGPYETIGQSSFLVYQMDVAYANGYEFYVWSGTTSTLGAVSTIWYCVRNASTGAYVTAPTIFLAQGPGGAVLQQPKLVVCGTTVVLTYAADSPTFNIYASKMSALAPATGWSAPVNVNIVGGDDKNEATLGYGPYDTAAVIGDSTRFALIYCPIVADVNPHISVQILNVSNWSQFASVNVDSSDATWTADKGTPSNAAPLAFAIRADSVNGEIGFAYSWKTAAGGGAVRVSLGLWSYGATPAQIATTVNLMTTPGPTTPTTDNAASVIAIERQGTVGASTRVYRLYYSPGYSKWSSYSGGAAGGANTYIAYWSANPQAGAMTVDAAQPRVTWGVTLNSRVLLLNGISYVVGFCPSSTQGSYFLLADDAYPDFVNGNSDIYGQAAWFPMRVVGMMAPRQSSAMAQVAGSGGLQNSVATHFALDTVNARYLFAFAQSLTLYTSSPARVPILFSSTQKDQQAELGENSFFASACPSGFDGAQTFELGFPLYPVIVNAVQFAGNIPAGTYSYIAIYEWLDARGQKHRSARSAAVSVVVGANKQVNLTVTNAGFSSKTKATNAFSATGGPQANLPPRQENVIKVYRTIAGGSVFFAITSQDRAAAINGLNGPTQVISDNNLDSAIQANPILYGDGSDGTQPGNILDNNCPPAFQGILAHKNRLWGIDGPRVWMSKAFTTGEGSAFNEAMAFSVDDGPGPLVALASMDERLILFKRDRLFWMSGDGPTDNGLNNDLSPPQRIASDVGCIDWRSVVSCDQGVFFMSPAGRRLLTRDMQVMPVPVVEDVDTSNPVPTSAVIHPSAGRLVFTENTDEVTSPRVGVQVLHDYVLKSWSQEQVSDGVHTSLGMVSAAVANVPSGSILVPTYHALRADGGIYRESSTTWMDQGSVFVPVTWTSPWLKSDGLQGWSDWRGIRLLLKLLDPCALTVTVSYDYNPAVVDTFSFTAAQIASFTTFLTQVQFQPVRQREPAMRITIADASDSGTTTGQGFLLVGLRVDYGTEPAGFRTPVAQQR